MLGTRPGPRARRPGRWGGAGVCPGQETPGLPSQRERETSASSASARLQLPRDLRAESSEEADRMIEAGR